MLKTIWELSQRATKKPAKKKTLTDEEKLAAIHAKQVEYLAGLPKISSSVATKSIQKDFNLDEKETENLAKKAVALGMAEIRATLEKLQKSSVRATKTLADGRVVGNHNNYGRKEDELLRDESGNLIQHEVHFKGGKTEICHEAPTTIVKSQNWTFKELDGCRSVERCKGGFSQIFLKPMSFKNPIAMEGMCGCAVKSKKIKDFCYEESINDEDRHIFKSVDFGDVPMLACNEKIHENGMCKKHAKMKSPKKWTEELLVGWTPVEISL